MFNTTTTIAPTTTLVIFDSQVTDLPLIHKALLPGSIDHTIQPHQDPIDHITQLLTQTGATKLAIVAHGQPGVIQIGNGVIDRAVLEARSGLLQEWGLDSIALYSCEVGADKGFIQRLGELTGAQIAATTEKVGAGHWELDGGMALLEIDRLADYSNTLATFTGTVGNDTATASVLSGFTGGTIADINDAIGDTFSGLDGIDSVSAGSGNDTLIGGNGNDILNSNDGNDYLVGGDGINILNGGGQDDRIDASYMRDTVDGGTGNDLLYIDTNISTDAYTVIFTGANAGKFQINGADTGTFTGIEQLYFIGYHGNDVINANLANLSVTTAGTAAGFATFGLLVNASSGNDIVLGSSGKDIILGGFGDDALYGQGGDDTIVGDEIFSSSGFDTIFGGAGIDTLSGGGLNDFIFGGTENDIINGDDGEDYLYGEDGDDTIKGGYGFDIIYGLAGNDTIYGEGITLDAAGNDTTVALGSGVGINDTIFGGFGNDIIRGGIGDDYILGEEGDDYIEGGVGTDFIYGGIGVDILSGQDGNDYIVGQAGNDILFGDNGIDYLEGGDGDDTIYGQNNEDYLYGNSGVDTVVGGDGNDFLDGGDGNDFLYGEIGNDVIFGVEGNDFLDGGFGVDYLYGGDGNDILFGNVGNDFLIGGAGIDKFNYLYITDAGDTITDFNPLTGGDNIDLQYLFNTTLGVTSGAVNTNYLQFFQAGADTVVQIDQDGTGADYGFVTMASLSNINTSQLSLGFNVIV